MNSKWKFFTLLSSTLLFVDQLTKYLIVIFLSQGEKIEILPHFVDVVHYRNPGAAFGLLASWASPWREVFFFLVAFFALVFLFYYFYRTPPQEKKLLTVLVLILSGALSNLIDRIFRGNVVDFILLHWYDKVATFQWGGKMYRLELVWPAFNVADSAITVGVVGLLWISLFATERTE